MMRDTCGRCGRKLHSHRSRKVGFGRECWQKMRIAVAALRAEVEQQKIGAFTPRQIDAAEELITDVGIAHLGDYHFEVISSDGTERYTATLLECTCPAGERGEECYHQVATMILQGDLQHA